MRVYQVLNVFSTLLATRHKSLFLNPIHVWHLSVEHNIGFFPWLPCPLLLTSISVRHPSITSPDGCDTACVPVTGVEQLTKKVGVPEKLWKKKKKRRKRTRSGLPFGLDEVSPLRSAKQIRIRDGTENICLCVTPPPSPSARLFKQRAQTEAKGAVCVCVPEGFGSHNPACPCVCVCDCETSCACVCHCPACPSLLSLLVLSGNAVLLQWVHPSVVRSSWRRISEEDKPDDFKRRGGKNAVNVFSQCCECLLELTPRSSWGDCLSVSLRATQSGLVLTGELTQPQNMILILI